MGGGAEGGGAEGGGAEGGGAEGVWEVIRFMERFWGGREAGGRQSLIFCSPEPFQL